MLNLFDFVLTPPADSVLYAGRYDFVLVALSVAVASFAAYSALLVSHFISKGSIANRHGWLIGGGLSFGLGVWAMHFIGMLAFTLPCTTSYESSITFISTIPAILASILALHIISHREPSPRSLLMGGILIGAGIGAMHYSGMAAMRLNGLIRYDAKLFALSILVAVTLAVGSLWIKFRLQSARHQLQLWAMPLSALVMGLAVSGMHYTAMAAAYFVRGDGQGAADSGISPDLLAAIVLTSTSLVIVATISATYLARPGLHVSRPYRLISMLLALWTGIVWLSSGNYYTHLSANLYQSAQQHVAESVTQLAGNIEENFAMLRGLALVASRDADTLVVLRRFGANVAPSSLPYELRKRRWTNDAALTAIDHMLDLSLPNRETDTIFLLNAAGDCVASSNAGSQESFVGSNYADRAYYKEARAERQGQQYAVGRKSNVPGFFFSQAIFDNKRFLGVVVIKRSITRYANWINQVGAFVVDANGVIVLASDKQLELHALPGAAVVHLTDAQRLAQYKLNTIPVVDMLPLADPHFPLAVQLGPQKEPVLLASKVLPVEDVAIHAVESLIEIKRHGIERIWLFALLATAGSLFILAASVIIFYLRESRRAKIDLTIAATAFESQEAMMVTDAENRILRVNRAFTLVTGYSDQEALGQPPSMLASGHHSGDFYREMWQQITQQGAWSGEIWNRRKNGEIYPEFLTISAVKGPAGEIINYVGTFNDISESKAAENEIKNLAFFDPLTHLPNRRLLLDRLNQALASFARSKREGALLFIDLDNFKAINDTLGHSMGDQLLQQVAQRLLDCVREGDTVARLGGDEFVVMLEDLSEHAIDAASQAEMVGEKILASLNQAYPLGSQSFRSTPSIGIALFSNQQVDAEGLMKQADIAMYQAKSAGKNTLRFFDPKMQESINERSALEEALRAAIANREFELYYQVQVDAGGKAEGAEALIRWRHPQRGFISPAQFIPLAEESGLMLPIGQWVIETACVQLKAWQASPLTRDLVLSVNVSAKQFHQVDFAEQVISTLQRCTIDPQRLKLELTESMLIDSVERVIETMSRLKSYGIQFSLDDFGTGYSSLQYLKRLPINQLKIDQSFVRDLETNANDKAIVRTIIAVAQSLGLGIIAEGVETAAQKRLLENKGCLHFQGYLFGKPMPIGEFERLLQSQ